MDLKRIAIGLAAVLAVGSVSAQSLPTVGALVYAEAGTVAVQGAEVAVASSVAAAAGDLVTVTSGQATITYSNGCATTVSDKYEILAVMPTCKNGVIEAQGDGMLIAGGVGAAALVGTAVSGGDSDKASSP